MATKKRTRKPEPIVATWKRVSHQATMDIGKLRDMLGLAELKVAGHNLAIIRLILADKKLEAIQLLLNPPAQERIGTWEAYVPEKTEQPK